MISVYTDTSKIDKQYMSRSAVNGLRRAVAESELDPSHCVFRSVSRLSRTITTLFDKEFAPVDLTAGHFTILMTLFRAGPSSVGGLAELLDMDASTIPRVLQPLLRGKLVTSKSGTDRRYRILSITEEGCVRLNIALPYWQRIQKRVQTQMRSTSWTAARHALGTLRESTIQLQRRDAK